MNQSYKSFGEMGRDFADENISEQKNRFEQAFGGQFETLGEGNFKSLLPGLESITISRPLPDKNGKVPCLNLTLFFPINGKEVHRDMSLDTQGQLIGPVPKQLLFSKEQLMDEILKIGETISQDFFEPIHDNILPPGKLTAEERGGAENLKKQSHNSEVDPRRLEFFKSKPQALFGIRGANSGFNGYYGFIFPKGIILENPKITNATYIITFPIVLNGKRSDFTKPKRQEIINQYFSQFANKTKQDMRSEGALQIIHPPSDDSQWHERMEQVVEKVV